MKHILLLLSFFITTTLQAQLTPETISIPMRDGQVLAAHLYRPDTTGEFPVILIQTPYNKNSFQISGLPLGVGYNLAASNYAFVILDWRCFYGSLPACGANINRGEDGYDAVEWIAEQSWSTGKIGTYGPSALGNIQYQTAREKPPHLVCCMPEVASPQTRYDVFYPGGGMILDRLQTLQILFGSYDLVFQNPYYNLLWQVAENSTLYPEEIEVPMFLVGGWFDHNTDEVLFMLDQLRTNSGASVQDKHKLIMGPWVHGGTGIAFVGSEIQGDLTFPEAAGMNREYGMRFFDYYLRDISNGWDTLSTFQYFQSGDNEWKTSEVWPPAGVANQTYYLQNDLEISNEMPNNPSGSHSFSYDPEDPSPTIGGKTLSLGLTQGPLDQTDEVESRKRQPDFHHSGTGARPHCTRRN